MEAMGAAVAAIAQAGTVGGQGGPNHLQRFMAYHPDSCHSRVIQNQQNLYPNFPPTAVVKLL